MTASEELRARFDIYCFFLHFSRFSFCTRRVKGFFVSQSLCINWLIDCSIWFSLLYSALIFFDKKYCLPFILSPSGTFWLVFNHFPPKMASTPVYAKFIHNGRINTVALIDGLSVDELTGLLKTVFTISGSIVGIMAEVRSYRIWFYQQSTPKHNNLFNDPFDETNF